MNHSPCLCVPVCKCVIVYMRVYFELFYSWTYNRFFVRIELDAKIAKQEKERNVLWSAIEPPLNLESNRCSRKVVNNLRSDSICIANRTNSNRMPSLNTINVLRMWVWLSSNVHKWYDRFFMVFCVFLWFVLLSCMHGIHTTNISSIELFAYRSHLSPFPTIYTYIYISVQEMAWLWCFLDWLNDWKCMFVITRTISKWEPKQAQINCRWTTLDMYCNIFAKKDTQSESEVYTWKRE